MANVDDCVRVLSRTHEVLVYRTGARALQDNLEVLGSITYSEKETEFARQIQQATQYEPTPPQGPPPVAETANRSEWDIL